MKDKEKMGSFLIVQKGANKGERHLLKENEMIIGRISSCEISLEDEKISRKHAKITKEGENFVIEDLGSSNLTILNGVPIRKKEILKTSDTVELGDTVLSFFKDDDMSEREDLRASFKTPPGTGLKVQTAIAYGERKRFDTGILQEDKELLKRAQRDLAILYMVSATLASVHDLRNLLSKVVEIISGILVGERVVVMLINKETGKLEQFAEHGKGVPLDEIPISKTVVNEVIHAKKSVLCRDTTEDLRFAASLSIVTGGIRSVLCVPIVGTEEVLGLIYVDSRLSKDAFSIDDLHLLTAIADETSIEIDRINLQEDLKELSIGSIKTLVALIEARDNYTKGHSERVASYSKTIAKTVGLDEHSIERIELAALLHDIGKIGVPDYILLKTSSLTEEEFSEVKKHPLVGAMSLEETKRLKNLVPGVRHHHERIDGKGYPDGITENEISIDAKIVCIADAFDAMTSDRPYRVSYSTLEALDRMRKAVGSQFSQIFFEAFLKAWETGNIKVQNNGS